MGDDQTPWHKLPGAPKTGTKLCDLSEIRDKGGKGFVFGHGVDRFDLLVLRFGDTLHGYVNVCPHMGTPLDSFPDRFLTRDKTEILCSTHGARFRIDDGFCTYGPCKDQSLTPVPVTVVDGQIIVGT